MFEFRNLRIRTKLILIQAATAFTAVVICSAIFVYNAISTFKESSINNKYSIAQVVGVNAASSLVFKDQDAANTLLSNLSTNVTILNAALLDKNGKVFAEYDKKNEGHYSFPESRPKVQLSHEELEDAKYLVTYLIIQDNELLGTLLIRSEYTSLNEIIRSDIRAAALISLLALAAAVILSFSLQRFISFRLLLLVDKTREITETGDYATRVEEKSADEIGVLTHEFNKMLEQIQKRDYELEQRVQERTAELEASNRELESFSYSVSHDMRAPIRALISFSRILNSGYEKILDQEGKEALSMIHNEASRMGQLIDDLLAFSRLGKKDIEKKKVNIKALAEDAVAEVLKVSELITKPEIIIDELPPAFCDNNLIRQVLINLISNAVKYSQRNPKPKVHIGTFKRDGKAVYYIKDNGVGFDMLYYNKLFGVFQRLHTEAEFKGTGIGLAIVQKIIVRHGGTVWAESTIGKGATFYFTLS